VKTYLFEDCLDAIKMPPKLQKNKYLNKGKFPVISQEDSIINGYTNDENLIFKINSPVIIFGDHTRKIKYIDFDFAIGADGVKIIKPKSSINVKFFFYYLMLMMPENLGYARHYRLLKKIKFNIPSLQEQQNIVTKLDAAFAEIDKAIDVTINTQKNIKNITQLFFNNIENKNISNLCENNIGELCNLMTGGTPNTKNKSYYKDGNIPWLVSGDVNKSVISNCEGRITELGYKNSNVKYLPINSVIIALNGQGKTRGTVALLKIKATCNQSLVSIFPKDEKKISTELIFYYLKSKYIQIRKITGDSGNDRRGLNMPLIRAIKIKYPENYEEQIKLVNKIKTITEYVMKIEENYRSKINNLLKLKQAILGNSLVQKDLEVA